MSKNNGKPCKNCGGNDWNGSGKCKKCKSDLGVRYRANNKEKVKAMKRRYYDENREKIRDGYLRWLKDNREKKAESDRLWAISNQEKVKANHRRWRSKDENKKKVSAITSAWRNNNLERERELGRKWRLDHPVESIARNHRRRALARNAPGKYTAQEWKELVDIYERKCLCCGRDDLKLTVDHVVPLSRGGSNYIDNTQPLCISCNDKKGAKIKDYRYTVMEQRCQTIPMQLPT